MLGVVCLHVQALHTSELSDLGFKVAIKLGEGVRISGPHVPDTCVEEYFVVDVLPLTEPALVFWCRLDGAEPEGPYDSPLVCPADEPFGYFVRYAVVLYDGSRRNA